MKHKEKLLAGELLVSHKGELGIELINIKPQRIEVHFKDFGNYVPCNPVIDRLKWHVKMKNNFYVLIIEWKCADVREIIWEVIH